MPAPDPISGPFDPRLPHGYRASRPVIERVVRADDHTENHGYERSGRSFRCVEGDACGRTVGAESPEYTFLEREEARALAEEARYSAEDVAIGHAADLPATPAREDLDGVGEALEALEELVGEEKKGAKNPKRSFFRRGATPDTLTVEVVREQASALRAAFGLAVAKVEARAGAAIAKVQREADRAKDTVAKFEIARVEAQGDSERARQEFEEAGEYRKRAREQLEQAEQHNKLRDETMRKLNELRSKVIGLARALGCMSLTTADEGAALKWLLEHASSPKKEAASATTASGDKLITLALLAELEERARVKRAAVPSLSGEVGVDGPWTPDEIAARGAADAAAGALEAVCKEWRERLSI